MESAVVVQGLAGQTVLSACGTAEKRRRKVVFVEGASAMGGVEFSTLYLVEHLDRMRWEPSVVCPEEGDLPEFCRRVGVPVHIVPRPVMRSTSIRTGSGRRIPDAKAWVGNAGAILVAARNLKRLLVREGPDLVVTKGMFPHFYGGLAARWAGIPCVWHVQDLVSPRYGGIYRRTFGQAARWLSTQVIADGGSIVRQLPRSVRVRARTIGNGIDLQLFRPLLDGTPVRRELGIPPDALVIGHAARMTPWKGQHHLLEAFAQLASDRADVRLLLVGAPVFDSDSYERSLRSRASELGLDGRIIFAGYRHDLPQVLAAMDIFAYPSVEKDTSPLSLLSAMAVGLPVVAFDIEGVREAIGSAENGLLVPVEQTARLANALVTLLADQDLRHRLGAGARRRAERAFSLEHHVSLLEEAFLEAIQPLSRASRTAPA